MKRAYRMGIAVGLILLGTAAQSFARMPSSRDASDFNFDVVGGNWQKIIYIPEPPGRIEDRDNGYGGYSENYRDRGAPRLYQRRDASPHRSIERIRGEELANREDRPNEDRSVDCGEMGYSRYPDNSRCVSVLAALEFRENKFPTSTIYNPWNADDETDNRNRGDGQPIEISKGAQ